MANTKKNTNVVHSDLIKAIKAVLNDRIASDNTTLCVSADEVASDKRIANAFLVKSSVRKLLVSAAIQAGQVDGFASRPGRNGGIHRVERVKRRSAKRQNSSSKRQDSSSKSKTTAAKPEASSAAKPEASSTTAPEQAAA